MTPWSVYSYIYGVNFKRLTIASVNSLSSAVVTVGGRLYTQTRMPTAEANVAVNTLYTNALMNVMNLCLITRVDDEQVMMSISDGESCHSVSQR